MLTVLTANSQAGGFTIANSLRFRSSASAYLNRTPASAGNRQTWTWSGWAKRGSLGSAQMLFSVSAASTDNDRLLFYFGASDTLQVDGATNNFRNTTQVFRDPSAWYHIVLVVDTTQATANNRMSLYVNGTQITAFSNTYNLAQNANMGVNTASEHDIGRFVTGASNYFDGYLTEINFIDGQALTPSSFGEIDSTTGVWKAKRYTGTYGTNGFRLNFSNGTSTTTLGYDSSGNGNNWTTNNISLTAGSTYDWMIDSPTKFPGSSYGVGNYAVLNAVASDGTISNANLTIAWTGGNSAKPSTIGMSSGKWYCEIYMDSAGTAALPGLIPSTMIPTVGYPGSISGSYGYYYDGQKYTGGAGSAYGASYTTGDIIGISFDADAGSLTFYKNGVSQGVAFSGIAAGTWFFAAGHSGTCTMSLNFGQRPFAYTPPSGYKSLCTQNLPGVTIQNGAAYMAATTYTGTGSSVTISNAVNGVSFQPDFVWIKRRNLTANHQLYDSIRGVQKALYSDLTSQELTQTGGITAFLSNGITVGSDAGVNGSGDTQVAWNWKAGGTAVTNTAGSITSSVSANQTAGFSVVTYTGTGSAATVGHGLGIAPSMVIVKRRNSTGDWCVWHTSVYSTYGSAYLLFLNSTDQALSSTTVFNGNTTSTTFPVVTNSAVNASGGTYVAYCFAAIPGYSAFGSYTGNGSADGPFVYCGFRPKYVLIKRTNDISNWTIRDTSRDPYNVTTLDLYSNLSNAETSGPNIDILSNGFKCRDAGGGATNASGSTYIFACFAENPFQNALAR